jgi:GH15 family glucan-1,4-alpha-glucosidase
MVEDHACAGPVERWRALRAEIHADVCRNGIDPDTGAFVQSYGSREPDASLLMIPLVGFLPASDPRMQATLAMIERDLVHDGFVSRYRTERSHDGLPPGEGTFLMCSFWLVDNLVLAGRRAEATALFERLLALRNDVGLLAEQYDPVDRRLLGNFPQAFSHVALITAAGYLAGEPEAGVRHE